MCSLKVTKIQRTKRRDGGDMCGWFAWGYTERQEIMIHIRLLSSLIRLQVDAGFAGPINLAATGFESHAMCR